MTNDTTIHDGTSVTQSERASFRVWDPMVRIFHWSLVCAFVIAYLSADELDTLHEVAGYVVAGLVAFRLIWGLIGSRYARFVQFLRGPSETIGYMGDIISGKERRYLGHNPAGAVMVVALLLGLSGTAFTGWLLVEPDRIAMLPDLPQIVAPAYADEDGEAEGYGEGRSEMVEEVHEVLANLMLLLIAVHIGGVVLTSFRHNENLARSMVTGNKRPPGPQDIA